MSVIPWWGLPLLCALFALAGAAAVYLVTARNDYVLSRRKRTRRWYEERKAAYVELLAVFERATYRLRAAYDAGEKPPGTLVYIDEVGPALMRLRLLASGSVRNAALAVHVLLQTLHGEMNPAGVPGVRPETHFRELLAQVPLVVQELEAAIREELGIETIPPAPPGPSEPDARIRVRGLLRRQGRPAALDEPADIGQDLTR